MSKSRFWVSSIWRGSGSVCCSISEMGMFSCRGGVKCCDFQTALQAYCSLCSASSHLIRSGTNAETKTHTHTHTLCTQAEALYANMIRAFILVGKSVFTETRLDNLKAPWRFPVKHFSMFERRDQLRLSLIELLQKKGVLFIYAVLQSSL